MNVPSCVRYDVTLTIRPERVPSVFKLYGGTIAVDCTVTVENRTPQALGVIPLLLYRLLHVDRVDDGAGQTLAFTQKIVPLEKEPRQQVNAIAVSLPAPLPIGASARVHIEYHGPVCGYPELMAYAQDHVSEGYTLLRWETLWYPLVGYPWARPGLARSRRKCSTLSRYPTGTVPRLPTTHRTNLAGQRPVGSMRAPSLARRPPAPGAAHFFSAVTGPRGRRSQTLRPRSPRVQTPTCRSSSRSGFGGRRPLRSWDKKKATKS